MAAQEQPGGSRKDARREGAPAGSPGASASPGEPVRLAPRLAAAKTLKISSYLEASSVAIFFCLFFPLVSLLFLLLEG